MGRSVPAITQRIEGKFMQWDKYRGLLNAHEKEAFDRLIPVIKNRRTAIAEADEADLGVAILLAVAVYLEGELCSLREAPGKEA